MTVVNQKDTLKNQMSPFDLVCYCITVITKQQADARLYRWAKKLEMSQILGCHLRIIEAILCSWEH